MDIIDVINRHNIGSGIISDVLDSLNIKGILPYSVKHLSGGGKIVGQAYTVQWMDNRKGKEIVNAQESTWSQVRDFLVPSLNKGDGRGKVYIAGAGNLLRHSALAGGISSTYFEKYLEFSGVILGGAIRDSEILTGLEIPVFATNFVPRDTQGSFHISSVAGHCIIDDQIVYTGDWVIADGDGVAVIPEKNIHEVLDLAINNLKKEQEVIAEVIKHTKLPNLIDKFGTI